MSGTTGYGGGGQRKLEKGEPQGLSSSASLTSTRARSISSLFHIGVLHVIFIQGKVSTVPTIEA